MPTSHVAVIDDQESVRHALRELLDAYGYQVSVFASAEAFLAAENRAGDGAGFGCVLCDVRMPGMDGLGLVRALAGALPVILMSGQADIPMAVAGLKAGAADFLEKPLDDKHLIAAINRGLAQKPSAGAEAARGEAARGNPAEAEAFERLTRREREVFDAIAAGHTSPSIAANLNISVRTVESYRAQAMEKLGLTSLAALVRLAVRLGRLDP